MGSCKAVNNITLENPGPQWTRGAQSKELPGILYSKDVATWCGAPRDDPRKAVKMLVWGKWSLGLIGYG